jgi:integral membrane sensor domain MASE1
VETWFWVAGLIIQAIIFGTIFRKAGYSGWLGLLMVVPLVNLVTLLWFAATTWPLEMGYTGQAENAKVDAAWELKMALRKAATLEKQARLKDAIKQLEAVAERAGEGHPNAALARERIRQLQAKVGGPAEPSAAADPARKSPSRTGWWSVPPVGPPGR